MRRRWPAFHTISLHFIPFHKLKIHFIPFHQSFHTSFHILKIHFIPFHKLFHRISHYFIYLLAEAFLHKFPSHWIGLISSCRRCTLLWVLNYPHRGTFPDSQSSPKWMIIRHQRISRSNSKGSPLTKPALFRTWIWQQILNSYQNPGVIRILCFVVVLQKQLLHT